ncbi:hypothetical protein ACHAWF_000746 [Thalassiosira exigua]
MLTRKLCPGPSRAVHLGNAIRKPLFGVVAALTKDGVIGVNGRLPWDTIPDDRNRFVNLTHDKILILGRKTFVEEDPTGAHVNHARTCIVVSKTMNASDIIDKNNGSIHEGSAGMAVKLARSFEEALDLASLELSNDDESRRLDNAASGVGSIDTHGDIDCWVVGGERIFQEALEHTNAKEVHLTHVNMTYLDGTNVTKGAITRFPLEYLENNGEYSLLLSSVVKPK